MPGASVGSKQIKCVKLRQNRVESVGVIYGHSRKTMLIHADSRAHCTDYCQESANGILKIYENRLMVRFGLAHRKAAITAA